MNRNQRILDALTKAGKTQADLAKELGVTRATISARFSSEKEIDSFEFLMAVSELTGKSPYWLYHGHDMPEMPPEVLDQISKEIESGRFPETKFIDGRSRYLEGKEIRPITVTVDRAGNELISYVRVKAQAGYMAGYSDPEFIEGLPAFSLPIVDGKGTMRMFQVDGDSMLQLGGGGLHDGDIVIGQYVEDIMSLKDNRVYVVVSTEGVVVKRVINRLSTSDKVLILKSDNKNGNYPDRLVHPNEILEVWELKAFISRQLSFSTDLWELINDLQAKQAILSERVDKIEGPRKLKQ